MIDDSQNIPYEEKWPSDVIREKIYEAADRFALSMPLLACTRDNVDFAYHQARRVVFEGDESRPYWMEPCWPIDNNILKDYLSNTAGWAENVVEEWVENRTIDLDKYRQNIAITQKMKEFVQEIKANKTGPIHNYMAMKKAVESKKAKTVIMKYKTDDGTADVVRVYASAFLDAGPRGEPQNCWYIDDIPLRYAVVLDRDLSTVVCQLPNSCIYLMPKDRVLAIKYRGKVIWKKES